MNHAMYSTDRHTYLSSSFCARFVIRAIIRRINSKSAREWLQLTIRLSAPDMPDGAAKHGKNRMP